ncbi:carbohydrate ABC transporter permease [Rhizobium puerariae]|uniref:Carbohydrate ABC transporter permease n=1 Tax=Rhizobium puerariae TaxID=1585791 RepID=A0ABV6AJ86_9HYPH
MSSSSRKARRQRAPLVWALPAVVVAFLFHYAAVAAGGWYAFTDWNGLTTPNYVGLANFRAILTNPDAVGALVNTLSLAVGFVIATNVIGLMLALALNAKLRSRFFLRSLFFAPVAISSLAIGYVWQFILEARGPLNTLLGLLGLQSLQRVWTADPTFSLWSVWLVMVWQFAGLCMAFYLAGLQSIPVELNEAAAVDGASSWRRFRRITFPLLAPAATISISVTTILGLRAFDQVMSLTRGGPGYASETLTTQIYKQTFVFGNFGYGAAFALVLTFLVLAVSGTQLLVLRARENRL